MISKNNRPARIHLRHYLLIWLLSVQSIACGKLDIENTNALPDNSIKILFIGNSLTYTNDMPSLLVNYAKLQGKSIKTESIALSNYALVDHLGDGNVQKLLLTKKYDYVVVQQGPSSQTEGRKLLFDATVLLDEICKKNGAKLAFFMVWPAHSNYWTFDGVIKNYSEAAQSVNAILCPVGTVWKEYIDRTNDLSYYGPDLFHPSLKGSQVAAEIIYKSIFK